MTPSLPCLGDLNLTYFYPLPRLQTYLHCLKRSAAVHKPGSVAFWKKLLADTFPSRGRGGMQLKELERYARRAYRLFSNNEHSLNNCAQHNVFAFVTRRSLQYHAPIPTVNASLCLHPATGIVSALPPVPRTPRSVVRRPCHPVEMQPVPGLIGSALRTEMLTCQSATKSPPMVWRKEGCRTQSTTSFPRCLSIGISRLIPMTVTNVTAVVVTIH